MKLTTHLHLLPKLKVVEPCLRFYYTSSWSGAYLLFFTSIISIPKLLCPAFKRISIRIKKEKERQNQDKTYEMGGENWR
jgi:hypothetical protein